MDAELLGFFLIGLGLGGTLLTPALAAYLHNIERRYNHHMADAERLARGGTIY